MDNPFKKRRTELITDRRTLLSLVSPVPIADFFEVDRSEVIDKLTMVVGTPGCGKTTIAQVVEFESLATLCAPDAHRINKGLVDILSKSRLLVKGVPWLLAHCLEMSTNFRDIWELPYPEPTRRALLRAFVQSKSVLGWYRQLESVGIAPEDVQVVLDDGAEALALVTRADNSTAFRNYAREIEHSVFKIVTALVPPDEQEMAERFLNTRYDVFEVLKGFYVKRWPGEWQAPSSLLKPMIIIDDAHELHPTQFLQLRDWLKSKAVGVSRWLMCRPDVVAPEDYRDAMTKEALAEEERPPGSTRGRDYVIKLMQLGNRDAKRFKPTAKDIANRYVSGIPEFSRRGITALAPMLDVAPVTIPASQLKQIGEELDSLARKSQFAPALVDALRDRLPTNTQPDEALAALRILMHRERNRSPQLDLLSEDSLRDEPVTNDRQAGSSLIEGGRIQLLHQFDRPYYYGMDKLIAASNANIEQFIRLAGPLVDELLARLVRGNAPSLSAKSQHLALVKQAKQSIGDWDFPYHAAVRQLVAKIAARCAERTKLPNAPLDDGANAIGVPQEEMDRVLARSERLTRVLHFAFAYRALVFVPQYRCKNKVWCLLELGALPCMAYGLTLSRGGFIEDTLSGLERLVSEEPTA